MGGATPQLSELQLAVLRVLWRDGELPVADVHERMSRERDLAPTTVATLLRRLEKRGVVRRRKEGRQFLYRAAVAQEEATKDMLSEVAERVFGGDVTALLAQLLDAREMRRGDLAKIRAMIEAKERELGES